MRAGILAVISVWTFFLKWFHTIPRPVRCFGDRVSEKCLHQTNRWGGLFDCGALPNLWPSWGVWFPPSGPVFATVFAGLFLGV